MWNTWNKELLDAIIEESDQQKKLALAEQTITRQGIKRFKKKKLPSLPPEEPTPEPLDPPTPKQPTPESSIEDIDFNIQDNLFGQVEAQFLTQGVKETIPVTQAKKKKGHLLNEKERRA